MGSDNKTEQIQRLTARIERILPAVKERQAAGLFVSFRLLHHASLYGRNGSL